MPFTFHVHSLHRGPRLAYVLDVLCERYGWRWAYAEPADQQLGGSIDVGVLAYGKASNVQKATCSDEVVYLPAAQLLSAPHGATSAEVSWGRFDGVDCPTGTDPLAGIFYCLALLGDYANRPSDAHGRLPAISHPLFLRGVARVPIADRLLEAVALKLWRSAGREGVPLIVPEPSAATSDVDAPRALHNKPTLRRATSLMRGITSSLRRDGSGAVLKPGRLLAYFREGGDPFDTFDYMYASARARGLAQDSFSLVGYGTQLDPGWAHEHPAWERFWRKLSRHVRLGIHPSYYSSERPELMAAEIRHLREVTGLLISTSRQHFLRLRIPETYRTLIECDIREDHTLMWADADGFRAGTARSFMWYDVRREKCTSLRLFPPHAMDVTARYYGGLSPKQAVVSWSELADEARASGTALRCVWHNSNLGPWYGWAPWRAAFEASLDLSTIR